MREIKFRGKNDFNDEWYYGYLFLNKTEDGYCVGYLHDYADVIESTVGQFTGLRDADGREIYEGDVLGASKTTVLVEWGVDGWVADCFTLLEWLKLHESHVIGNIYDSPELLEADHEGD